MRREGIFDRAAAERLITRQAELSEETGCPSVLHLYARSTPAFEQYLDFADQVWSGPFIIDSADAAMRAAQLHSSPRSWDTRTRPSTTASAWLQRKRRRRQPQDSEIDSAIVLAYNPAEPGVDGSLAILETGGTVREKGLLDPGP